MDIQKVDVRSTTGGAGGMEVTLRWTCRDTFLLQPWTTLILSRSLTRPSDLCIIGFMHPRLMQTYASHEAPHSDTNLSFPSDQRCRDEQDHDRVFVIRITEQVTLQCGSTNTPQKSS